LVPASKEICRIVSAMEKPMVTMQGWRFSPDLGLIKQLLAEKPRLGA
jgi:hypothetical protein